MVSKWTFFFALVGIASNFILALGYFAPLRESRPCLVSQGISPSLLTMQKKSQNLAIPAVLFLQRGEVGDRAM